MQYKLNWNLGWSASLWVMCDRALAGKQVTWSSPSDWWSVSMSLQTDWLSTCVDVALVSSEFYNHTVKATLILSNKDYTQHCFCLQITRMDITLSLRWQTGTLFVTVCVNKGILLFFISGYYMYMTIFEIQCNVLSNVISDAMHDILF